MYFKTPIDYTQQIMANISESVYYYRYDFNYNKSPHEIVDHLDIDGKFCYTYVYLIFTVSSFPLEINTLRMSLH